MGSTLSPIAVTMGDPAGIGGEVILKSWLRRRAGDTPFFVIDHPGRLSDLALRFGLTVPIDAIAQPRAAANIFASALPVLPLHESLVATATLGIARPETVPAVIASIDRAVALARSGEASAIVTAPIHKHAMDAGGFGFPGHTEYLGHLAGERAAVMMLCVETVDPPLRVIPVTIHVPLASVASALTTDAIVSAASIGLEALARDFGIAAPRLAVAALNPHGGESGMMGREEETIIRPAVAALATRGHRIEGPFPADTLFHPAARARFDAVVCMYHDQALIPIKTIDFAGGVNVTLGLPFVRTSPDHGTALDIAPRGIADPASMIQALGLAARLAAFRSRAA